MRALLRIAVVWNIPIACNRATADYMISSPLLNSDYVRLLPDYGGGARADTGARRDRSVGLAAS